MRKTNLKGPWYAVQPYECAGWWVVATDPEGNDTVDESGDGGFEKETAHLIAAAPELYEALVIMVAMCESAGDFRNGVTDPNGTIDEGVIRSGEVIRDARAALAKARGEA